MGVDLSKLSPRARKALLAGRAEERVRATVELAPGASPDSLDTRLESLGGVVRSWSAASHVMTLSLPCGRLAELADDRAVVYVEAGGALSSPERREGEDAMGAMTGGRADARGDEGASRDPTAGVVAEPASGTGGGAGTRGASAPDGVRTGIDDVPADGADSRRAADRNPGSDGGDTDETDGHGRRDGDGVP